MKCPRCGGIGREKGKEWNYAVFHVKVFICENCGKDFKAYYIKDKLSHTIPKNP